MKQLNGTESRDYVAEIKLHDIVFVWTSSPDYEEERICLVEHWVHNEHDYALIRGNHCSCYSWDDVDWSVDFYTEEELVKLVDGYSGSSYPGDADIPLKKYVIDVLGLGKKE